MSISLAREQRRWREKPLTRLFDTVIIISVHNMARKRDCNFYVLKDEDVSSPNSKKQTSDEKSPVQNFARRDLTKEFERNSSGDDSIVEIVLEDDDARR